MSASESDLETQRAEMRAGWDRVASGWGKRVARVRDWGMPVSAWMIDHLGLQPGQTVLELAAGPGDTGFLAAELVAPAGKLICSDATEAMVEIARERASSLGVANVEFKQLELEWIDLPTASVDAVLCRWAVMLAVDPAAALREARRVLAPGGRMALAVWDDPAQNPWATIPTRTLIELGHAEPADREGPGMFALASEVKLRDLIESAGFVEVLVEAVALERVYPDAREYFDEQNDLSMGFSAAVAGLDEDARERVVERMSERAAKFAEADGTLRLPGRSLVACAEA